MNSEIIALIGSALGTLAGIIINTKFTTYRIEQLEKNRTSTIR